jgi:CubicO group peptidase (beta-lactamase class C family)
MHDSGYDSNTSVIARRAAGYEPSPKGPVNAGFVHMTIPFSAGALYSTTEDLLRWEQGLFSGKVLSAASLLKMTTPFKNDYAFGLQVRTVSGRKVIDHDGGIEGFNTVLAAESLRGRIPIAPGRRHAHYARRRSTGQQVGTSAPSVDLS